MNLTLSAKRALATALAPLIIFAAVFSVSAKAEDAPQPALWKLTDHDSEVWLFGTVHLLDPKLKWQTAKVTKAFNASNTVYFEADTGPEATAGMQALIGKFGLNPQGTVLSSLLSEKGNTDLAAAIAQLGLPQQAIANFEPLRPWFASLNLAIVQLQKQGLKLEAGVEKTLEGQANAAGKKIAYFETAASQIEAFGSLSAEAELTYLENGLDKFSEADTTLNQMVTFWVTGNSKALGDLMNEGFSPDEVYEALLTKRNRNWAAQIKEIMDGSGKVFIAVGAGHLAGKNSVQDLLAEYQLKAVRQ
ncbi:MAG: TraB/GumN family protein [Kordiimonadales bacterium]|nr:MAG: TraB/GumN family protein [Kordiimonadales bacterium]